MARLSRYVALVLLHHHDGDVVELDRVGQRDQLPVGGADGGGLVVEHPVADVFHAGAGEQFRRLQGLGQAGAEPAERALAGEALDDVHGAMDHLALVVVLVHGHLVIGMAHEFPALAPRLLGDAGIVLADPRIDRERRLDAVLLEQIEEAPHADPHAVFVPRPMRDVRQQRNSRRRRQHLARHRPGDVPDLEIDDRPYHEPCTAGQLQWRPVDDRRKVAALPGNHGLGHADLHWRGGQNSSPSNRQPARAVFAAVTFGGIRTGSRRRTNRRLHKGITAY